LLKKKSGNYPFTTAKSYKQKYLGIGLSEEVKDIYNENYEILMSTQNRKISCVHKSEELILLKYALYTKQSIDSM
jgi:hypothetical protein